MALHSRTIWLTVSWLWLLTVIILSLIAIPKSVDIAIPYLDKVEHVFSYFVLMFLFSQCYTQKKTRVIYAIGFILVGIILEVLQGFTVVRKFEYADMIANTSGVVFGMIMADSFLHKIVIFVDEKLKKLL